jgi:hypothetical protein
LQRQGKDPLQMQGKQGQQVLIVSYHFVVKQKDAFRRIAWDRVVIDEAHKLCNAYRASSKLGQALLFAVGDCRKILLTATPLQNSLDELYGLSHLIDPHLFGDIKAFRSQYSRVGGDLPALKQRLQAFTHRTLREEVKEYIQYTERHAMTQPFRPSDDEHGLYEAVSQLLQREDSYALPPRQRHLMTLVTRKLLASSSVAVADTLDAMRKRLQHLMDERVPLEPNAAEADALELEAWVQEVLSEDDVAQWQEDELFEAEADDEAIDDVPHDAPSLAPHQDAETGMDYTKLQAELHEVSRLVRWARTREQGQVDGKSSALLQALATAFTQMQQVEGAQRPAQKALVFTESRRTQQYLYEYLSQNGYRGQIVLFSGSNNTPDSASIHEQWQRQHAGTDRVSGSRDVDMRAALVDYFRDHATLMIATEAAAEGVNMQFCSLVVNYDLPWNPQRVEQRIGRCHRYGQKHDVVVINFLNERNEADQRVLELLGEKFRLFDGVFGASDDVLGSIESGVDFEKRVLRIYQNCRTPEQIKIAFDALQKDMQGSIEARMRDTQAALLNHFDQDVHDRLKLRLDQTQAQLDRFGKRLWALTRWQLGERARFDEVHKRFELLDGCVDTMDARVPAGWYHLKVTQAQSEVQAKTQAETQAKNTMNAASHVYRLSHPLAQWVLNQAKTAATPQVQLCFDVSHHPVKLSMIEALRGQSGYLMLTKLRLDNAVDSEEHLLFSAVNEAGQNIAPEVCEKLFEVAASSTPCVIPEAVLQRLQQDNVVFQQATLHQSMAHNNAHFQRASAQLEQWADDCIHAAEKALEDIKVTLKQWQRQARSASTLDEQQECQKKISEAQRRQRQLREKVFDVEDEIKDKRDAFQSQLAQKVKQSSISEVLFCVGWAVQ